MNWDQQRVLAVALWPACAAIFFIASCRLNAMPRNTRWAVVVEYAIWAGIGFTVPFLPLVGEWPGPGMVLLTYGLVLVLLCSARAWAGDIAPDEATDASPLQALTWRQAIELRWMRLRARLEVLWQRAQFWKVQS
ncbi:multidrug transporter EmrE-like cation transporter [Variovorax sp. SG517]|uniref:hypothetical protein n=1 Tax=Variovorax sp. SG517 TaxID=2587117 RepID=UPI00159D2A8A|nr:hypothetical protein [Variovorax sp. SG517]NVM87646.1 multidrug transporter EmrE-like cation transporter [Variovorax sp. SG517]